MIDLPGPLIKLVNCAGCDRELLGASLRLWFDSLPAARKKELNLPPLVAGRINDRPYCRECHNQMMASGGLI